MDRKEFEAKLKQVPVVEPDEMDRAMLAEIGRASCRERV